jgi:hypothetical protein
VHNSSLASSLRSELLVTLVVAFLGILVRFDAAVDQTVECSFRSQSLTAFLSHFLFIVSALIMTDGDRIRRWRR